MFTARDAQRALDKLLTDCDTDSACKQAFPDLSTRIRNLLQRLEQSPPTVRIVHPRTGVAEDVRVEARVVASILFSALYSSLTGSIVPALIEHAEHNEFQSFFALGLAGEGGDASISVGMQLSVLCSEDAPRVTASDVQLAAAGTLFGTHLLSNQLDACAMWPRGSVDAAYYEPVVSDVPALVLSGDIDPVTPPSWGESVVKTLKNGRHITAPGTGHGRRLRDRARRESRPQRASFATRVPRCASRAVRRHRITLTALSEFSLRFCWLELLGQSPEHSITAEFDIGTSVAIIR